MDIILKISNLLVTRSIKKLEPENLKAKYDQNIAFWGAFDGQ